MMSASAAAPASVVDGRQALQGIGDNGPAAGASAVRSSTRAGGHRRSATLGPMVNLGISAEGPARLGRFSEPSAHGPPTLRRRPARSIELPSHETEAPPDSGMTRPSSSAVTRSMLRPAWRTRTRGPEYCQPADSGVRQSASRPLPESQLCGERDSMGSSMAMVGLPATAGKVHRTCCSIQRPQRPRTVASSQPLWATSTF
jgi:hypothetical protein